MTGKRESIKTVRVEHGNNVTETFTVKDEEDTADILRAALAIVEAPKHDVKAVNKMSAELREEQAEISVEEAAHTLEKALENSNVDVDVSQLKEALLLVSHSEGRRFSGREAGEKLQRLFAEIDGGGR
ncbi:hypothetical protein MOF01_08030 [Bacillus spizizenii]|nr:hypothetical protein [Bacillus spizizenii]